MIKYIKWILLSILIILIVGMVYTFINYTNNTLKAENNLSKLYEESWFRTKVGLYSKNDLISENDNLNDSRYLIFTPDYVKFCDATTDECKNYKYSLKNDNIFFDSETNFIENGNYDITFNDDGTFSIAKEFDNNYVRVYTFTKALG